MAIHIGKIIKERVKKSSLTNKEISERINRVEGTIYDIYKRETIDTGILLKLCEVLEFDFFKLYYGEEPLKTMCDSEIDRLRAENKDLKTQLDLKNDHIKDLKEIIAVQKEKDSLKKKN